MKNYERLAIEAALYDNVPLEKGRDEMLIAIRRDSDELTTLRAENAELVKALEAITERAEAVSEGIHVEKRSEGVSQAQHVRHMAHHLAQHAKIARAALSKHTKSE